MNNRHRTRILAFCLEQIPSATLGVEKVLKYLHNQNKVEFLFKRSIEVNNKDVAWADIVIPIRSCEDIEVTILEQAKKAGKYIIYFLDDDLLNIPKEASCSLYFEQKNIRENIITNMKLSNVLWTTNLNIKDKYEKYTEKSCVIHVPIEKEDLYLFQQDIDRKRKIIVGFAGSKDHGIYLETLLKDTISDIAEKYKKEIRFEFFGGKPKFIEENSLFTYIDYEDNYTMYRKKMEELQWDIAIAPLKESDFHGCKYFNKYIEYSSMGIAGIYSKVAPYTFVIEDKRNGILVENRKEDWEKAILDLASNRALREKIVKNSQEQLICEFTIEEIAKDLTNRIPEILNFRAPLCKSKDIKIGNSLVRHYYHRIKYIIREDRLDAPRVILLKALKKLKSIINRR